MFIQEAATPENLEAIALVQYIDELGKQLSRPDIERCDEDEFISRSPSPPPEYDKYGKRTNTREHRIRNFLNVERTLAVRKALELIPDYVPPSDFSRLARIVEKYPIPVRDFPQINFVGLLLGPRGNALRRMETDSGARISIRGRGSVKEGSRSATAQQGQEEDLHCLVSATSPESIGKAFRLIKQVVDTATQTPEHQNDFKRLQLRELAELNGTLRDYENQLCTFCGEPGHRKFACPQREAALRDAVCRICGQQGHLMRDCDSAEAKNVQGPQPAGLQDFLDDLEDDAFSENAQHVASTPSNTERTDNHASITPQNGSSQVTAPPGVASPSVATARVAPSGVLAYPDSTLPSAPPRVSNADTVTPAAVSSDVSPAVGSRGLAPPGVGPPGLAPQGVGPPGVGPPGITPPVMHAAGSVAPGITPSETASRPAPPGVAAALVGETLSKDVPPPPSAWRPPTWKPPATPP